MQKKKMMALFLALTCTAALFSGCGKSETSQDSSKQETTAETDKEETKSQGDEVSTHEVIKMQAPFRNMSAFIDVVHEKYPEINLEAAPYSGANYSSYAKAQLTVGELPDIYCTTVYSPGREDLSEKLIDLSGYSFTDNYQEARLREVTDEGAIYFLPSYYTCIGITYNKTLMEKNGWEVPANFKELEELASKVKEAGYNLALNQLALPGCGFQYMCNILDTGYLNTLGGKQWQNDFLDGKTTLAENAEMKESFSMLDRWRDIGMLTADEEIAPDLDTRAKYLEGNTVFLIGSSNIFTEDETDDEFGLMPYLSEDGSSNAYILNVSRYTGVNKDLEKEGNEQKLEDALHVMEVLSTVEGMQALNSDYVNASLLPLKDYEVAPGGYYADIEDDLNNGYTAPYIYAGWENVAAPIGTAMQSYCQGKISLEDVMEEIDASQELLNDTESQAFTTVTETIDTETCAKLVGICFAQATGADMSLVSMNKWYKQEDDPDLNTEGVSGELYALPTTDLEITTILPTGWSKNIQTVTLSGKRIKELAETGYEKKGYLYPYELVTKEGFEIDDDTTYTVAICGVADDVAEEGSLTDTGILGLKAAEDYLSQFETLSAKDIVWK